MARSASDATRFTATGPYAHSKPGSRASTIAFASPAPPNETPQQKVARLREAARRAKLSQESNFDKVVARGRLWADRAHRITALGLIAVTGIAGLITVFSLGDMIIYNRRKRREYYADQEKKHAEALVLAREAAAQGIADEDQMLLLNRERAAAEAEERNKKGMFTRAKDTFYSGLSKEEQTGGKLGAAALEGKEGSSSDIIQAGNSSNGLGILKAVEDTRREGEKALGPASITGGPLDQIGEQTASSVKATSKSWTSWISGK